MGVIGLVFSVQTLGQRDCIEEIELGRDENESVRGALRPGVVIGAKCFGSRNWLRKEPNVIPPRRVKKNAL